MVRNYQYRHIPQPVPGSGDAARREGLQLLARLIARCQLNSGAYHPEDGAGFADCSLKRKQTNPDAGSSLINEQGAKYGK